MNPEIEAHLRMSVNFPSPPGVATHIIELAQDPDIEMGKVAKALSMDSALSTKILRIANSPLYAQRRKSENLRQALVVLGLNATLTLALSFSLVKSLRGGKSNGLSYGLYWRRALLAATAARALGDAMHQSLAEEIFLAALLQDVGMLALDKAVPDLYSRRRSSAAQPCRARRARKETPAGRSCPRRRLADAGMESARAPVSRHRAQPSVGPELQRRPGADLRPLRRAVRSGGGSVPAGPRAAAIRRDRAVRGTQPRARQDGVRPGPGNHRRHDSRNRSHLRSRFAGQTASGIDSRAGARSTDAAQPACAARNQHPAGGGGRRLVARARTRGRDPPRRADRRLQPRLSGSISGARIRELDAPQMAVERGFRGSGQLQAAQRQLRPSGRRSDSAGDRAHSCAATPARPT